MAKVKKGDEIDGLLLIDKQQGFSSNQALQKTKRILNAKKAGHTGTLDPMATGLLPVCLGKMTKLSTMLLDSDKVYSATIQLGILTDSGDSEGVILKKEEVKTINETEIKKILNDFIGNIQQIPPMYSALKHNGKKLYELARKGIEIERKSRDIIITSLDLVSYDDDKKQIKFIVKCSKGTYVRTLAEDISRNLGTIGSLITLRREKCCVFDIKNAISPENLGKLSDKSSAIIEMQVVLNMLDYNVLKLSNEELLDLLQLGKYEASNITDGNYQLKSIDNDLIGILEFSNNQLCKKILLVNNQKYIDNLKSTQIKASK